jgi:hypothetical protein
MTPILGYNRADGFYAPTCNSGQFQGDSGRVSGADFELWGVPIQQPFLHSGEWKRSGEVAEWNDQQ